MRRMTIAALAALCVGAPAWGEDGGFDAETCSFNGVPLHGEVQVVESFPDFEVQIVDSFPDLNVEVVENFPDDCGEWEFVENFPDFTIRFVTSFPDFKIEFVDNFPGVD